MVSQVQLKSKLEREILYAAGADGVRVTLGVLADGRCALDRAGDVIDVWEANTRGIAAATSRFASLTTPADPTRAKRRPPIMRAGGNLTPAVLQQS